MVPEQKPNRSKQDYQTPPGFLRAVERDFRVAAWAMDLAANEKNAVCARYLGPGSPIAENGLTADWPEEGDLWLNPPFGEIAKWAGRCSRYIGSGRVFMLVPASVGSNWYVEHVDGKTHVIAVRPRLCFVGEKDPYPKDVLLAINGAVRGGFSTWKWKK